MKVSVVFSLALLSVSTLSFAEIRKSCFKVEGMTCDSCAKGINSLVGKQKGVKSIDTSFPKKHSIVTFENKETNLTELKKHFEIAGYQVSEKKCP